MSPKLERLVHWIATAACLVFLFGAVDVRLGSLRLPVPSVPAQAGDRDAELLVRTLNAHGSAIADAEVRVYWERDARYFEIGQGRTDATGRLHLPRLPRGAHWVLADSKGHARRSARVVLSRGPRELELQLGTDEKLAVKVVDDRGAPISRATVLAHSVDPLPRGALTNAEGQAELSSLPPAPWKVKVSARGYESVTRDKIEEASLLVTLRRLGGLEVNVQRADGTPADEAVVTLVGSRLWPARKVPTDKRGVARVVGLLSGIYELKAEKGSLVSSTLSGVRLERGELKSVTLRLLPGRMVTARVTDGDDEDAPGVPNADVILTESGISSFPRRGRTSDDGTVTLGPIAPGPATLAAYADEFVPRSAVPVPEDLEGPVQVPLIRGGILRGDVVDARGFPVDGASVEVIGTDVFGLPVAQTPAMMNFGRAHFDWSLAGPLPLMPAGELGVTPGPVPPIPGAPLTIESTQANLSSGAGLAALVGESDAEQVDAWVTESDGSFTARPVTPGRVRALVRHPDYVEAVSELVTLAPGGEAHVKVVLLRGGILEGRVLDERDFPVAGARVDVAASEGTLNRTTLTTTDGSFAFAAVPSSVLVSVARPSDITRFIIKKELRVPAGERTELQLTLPAEREPIQVQVKGGDEPLENAMVTALSLDPELPLRQTRFTREDGRVLIEDAAGMPLRLIVEAPRWVRRSQTFQDTPETVTLRLERGILVRGRITAVRGRFPVSNAHVAIQTETGRHVGLTDDTGQFDIQDVPAGPVEVLVSHPEYASASVRAQVARTERIGRPHELEPIDLKEGGVIEGVVLGADAEPVMGARVSAGEVPKYLPAGALPAGMATTDTQGRFKLQGVVPGAVRLEAYAAGIGKGRSGPVQVRSGRSTTDVEIQLEKATGDDDVPLNASVAVTLAERDVGEDEFDIVVSQVAQGSEAERAGVKIDDIVLSVDGKQPETTSQARRMLSGPYRTDVVLEVLRGDQSRRLRVAREPVRQ